MTMICAIVVGYKPDKAVLERLLTSLKPQVSSLIFINNGGLESRHVEDMVSLGVTPYDMGANIGLGAALNFGFSVAVELGADYVLTFDQDSEATDHLVADLLQGMEAALKLDEKCIAVAPAFFDRRAGERVYFPFYSTEQGRITAIYPDRGGDELVSADVLITSGMCIRASAWAEGMKYDEALFVDFTDTEWCFRAKSLGFSLYGYSKAAMGHALSDAPPLKLLGLSFFKYSPVRRYYYFRNAVAVAFRDTVPTRWRRRLLIGLFIKFVGNLAVDPARLHSARMMFRGVCHGVRNDLGPWH